jgi:hypothetical protein
MAVRKIVKQGVELRRMLGDGVGVRVLLPSYKASEEFRKS